MQFLFAEVDAPARFNALTKLLNSLEVKEHDFPMYVNDGMAGLCRQVAGEAAITTGLSKKVLTQFIDAREPSPQWLFRKAGQRKLEHSPQRHTLRPHMTHTHTHTAPHTRTRTHTRT